MDHRDLLAVMTGGVRRRHTRSCASRSGGRCRCRGSWEASVYSARDGRKVRRSFATEAAAKRWRTDAARELAQGTMRAPSGRTFAKAAEDWLAGAEAGAIRTRSGDPYKPSTVRGYRDALRLHLLDALGPKKLTAITRQDVQWLADRIGADRDPSTVRNALAPLRVIFRREARLGEVASDPTVGLELPAVRGRRDRIADPREAELLLAALAPRDRPLWATALYAGLRRGELAALRWSDVDLAGGVIRVERAYDPKARVYVEPKSRAGRRSVPVAAVLRDHLAELRAQRTDPAGDALVFGHDGRPFDGAAARRRAFRRWEAAGLAPIAFHEARHTFASLMIAAGVNAKALSAFMGHATVTTTLDRYGHLMPGAEAEAAGILDRYLDAARADARAAVADPDRGVLSGFTRG